MAFNLSALAGQTAALNLQFGGQTAKITYDPSILTTRKIQTAETSDAEFKDFFCELVTAWDVVKGTRKVPLKPESLDDIPLVFLRAIFRNIMEQADDSAGEAESNSSVG